MGDFVQQTHQEFWRPPSPTVASQVEEVSEPVPSLAETCPRCGREFLLGSRFCHSCGGRRPVALTVAEKADAEQVAGSWSRAVAWMRSAMAAIPFHKLREIKLPSWLKGIPSWMRYLHFHEIKDWLGLTTASLVAFTVGLGCVVGSLLVALLPVKTLVDWQAIQFYRVQWLLGATAAFVAGILLKKPSSSDRQ